MELAPILSSQVWHVVLPRSPSQRSAPICTLECANVPDSSDVYPHGTQGQVDSERAARKATKCLR